MQGTGTLHLFRLIHIVFGALWVGAAVFAAFFLLPTVRALGPAGGPVMQQLTQVRKVPVYMMLLAILTILSGIGLYWRDSSGFTGEWMHTGTGAILGLGGLLGILAVVLGMAIVTPTAKRLGELAAMQGSGGPPAPAQVTEMQTLQARMARFMSIVAVLLLLATAAMAIARYVP